MSRFLGGLVEDTWANVAQSLIDWKSDPESDIETVVAVERAHGVTFE